MRSPRRFPWFSLFLACVLVVSACRSPDETTARRLEEHPLPADALRLQTRGVPGGSLDYCLPGEPTSFNFTMAGDTRTQVLTSLTTGTLLEFDRFAQEVVPGVAREWTVSEDARTVNLILREGLRFSDGTEMSAEDVLFTFRKIYQEGSENLIRSALQLSGMPLSVTKVDRLEVRIEFPEPHAAAAYILSTVPVLPRHLFPDPARQIEDYWNLSTPPEEMAGLGPFFVSAHSPAERTILRRNPHYWKIDSAGDRLPFLDEIVVHYVEDRNGQLLRFQAGEIDLLDYQLRPEDYLQLAESGSSDRVVNAGPSSHLTFFWFNQSGGAGGQAEVPPEKLGWFRDPRFRTAVSLAVSRETIARNIFLGQASPAWTLVPSSIPDWHLAVAGKRDVERARDLLRAAGFARVDEAGKARLVDPRGNRVEVTLLTRSDAVYGKIGAVLQQDLAELGIHLNIQQEEFRSVISRVTRSRDYEAALMAIEIPYEPSDHVGILLSSSQNHFWNPGQAEPATEWEARIDRLMSQMIAEMDFPTRQALYREVQQILLDQSAIIPLVNKDVLVAGSPMVHNLRPANLYPYGLWNAWELWMGR